MRKTKRRKWKLIGKVRMYKNEHGCYESRTSPPNVWLRADREYENEFVVERGRAWMFIYERPLKRAKP